MAAAACTICSQLQFPGTGRSARGTEWGSKVGGCSMLQTSPFPSRPWSRRAPSSQRLQTARALPTELVQLADAIAILAVEEGPVELPPELEFDPLANVSEFSPLQIGASFVLTGVLAFLLFRAVQKRLKRAKELQFRSSGAQRAEDARRAALLSLQQEPEIEAPPPSALQTLSGAVVAGGIAFLLYQFATTVEASFAGRAVSPNYSVRNITVTVRTIINGLCYLSTFVFAANSVGLTLYALQLALNQRQDSSSPSPSPSTQNSSAGSNIEESKTD